MANENALQDDNRVSSLIVDDGSGTRTIRVKGNTTTGAVMVDTSGAQGLSIPAWDYMTRDVSGSVETYTYYTGGTGGVANGTLTVTYTGTDLSSLANVLLQS